MTYLTYLDCKHCQRPIPLLYSKHPPSPGGPEWWPRDNRPVNFLCPSCKHVCEYSVTTFHQDSVGEQAVPSGKCRAVFLLSKPCASHNCGSLLQIHSIMTLTGSAPVLLQNVSESALQEMAEAESEGAVCRKQLLVTTSILREGSAWACEFVSEVVP